MDTDDGRNDEPAEFVHEDFSVYVPPPWVVQAAAQAVPDDEPLARLEPTFGVVWMPLIGLLALFLAVLSPFSGRYRIPVGFLGIYPWNARYIAVTVLGAVVLVAALPYFLSSSFFAELYGDRLVVRRGKREWAAPLEEIASITPVNDPSPNPDGPWWIALLEALARTGSFSDLTSGTRASEYVVVTSFGLTFPIPPFPGAEAFVTKVYQQRAARLKMRPPVVPIAGD